MADFNPLGGIDELLGNLIQQQASPQRTTLRLDIAQKEANIQQMNILNNFLSNVDTRRTKPSEVLRGIAAITGNPQLISGFIRQVADEQELDELRTSLGGLSETVGRLAPGGIMPGEAAEIAAKEAKLGIPKSQRTGLAQFARAEKPISQIEEEETARLKIAQRFQKSDIKGNLDLTLKLRESAFKRVKNYDEIEENLANINSAIDRFIANPELLRSATEQAVIISFNKILDPGSVVRESEFARIPGGESLLNRAKAALNKIPKGGVGVSTETLEEIRAVAMEMAEAKRQIMNNRLQDYRDIAARRGLDPDEVAPLFEPIGMIQSYQKRNKSATIPGFQVPGRESTDIQVGQEVLGKGDLSDEAIDNYLLKRGR